MMKIASPLFILRDECKKDLMYVLERIAEMGYDGVEFLGTFGHAALEIRRKLDSLNLDAVGDHVSYHEFKTDTDRVITTHKELGCDYITVGSPFNDGEEYSRIINTLEEIGTATEQAGIKLLFHNHSEELRITENGKSILENLMDDINPELLALEPDFGWMQIGGANPEYYLKKYSARCPVLHFKDYIPTKDGFIFRPTGYGVMNNAGLYALSLTCNPQPEWYVMDHDCAYTRDIYGDLKMCLDYFRSLSMIHNTDN